jgi:hypothetical protein
MNAISVTQKVYENINEYFNFFIFNGLNMIKIQTYKYLL